jgi:Rrf2 family transcriptional regulator, repressor of oqxAB
MAQGRFALAVHALVLLANSPQPTTSAFLAGSVNTHATCMRRVLATLVQADLVQAAEGREGGYRLARPAAEITLADVYLALAGEPVLRPNPAAVNPCCPVSVAMGPAFAEIAADAESRFKEALAGRTLADLTQQIDSLVRWAG